MNKEGYDRTALVEYGNPQPMPRPAGSVCATIRDRDERIVAHVFGTDLDRVKERVRKIIMNLGLTDGEPSGSRLNLLNRLHNRLPGKVTHAEKERGGGLRFSYDGRRYRIDPSPLRIEEVREGTVGTTDRTRLMEELLRGG